MRSISRRRGGIQLPALELIDPGNFATKLLRSKFSLKASKETIKQDGIIKVRKFKQSNASTVAKSHHILVVNCVPKNLLLCAYPKP